MTQVFNDLAEWQSLRNATVWIDKTIGLVPTMGNLHAGHKSLLQRSVAENAITVLTIFVNPTQFSDPLDLNNYPKTLQEDLNLAEATKVDYVLIPQYKDIYADDYRYKICENELSKQLCGKQRAGHFEGVMTVVLKLLMLVKAHNAYFGEKDFQQLQLIKGLAQAFFIDTNIIACPTIRNEQGLALSSRNNLLTPAQLKLAQAFPKLLNANLTIPQIIQQLTQLGFSVDYIEEHSARRFGAVRLGAVRLIDNFAVREW